MQRGRHRGGDQLDLDRHGVADTVKIDNTGSLNSTFAMSMPAAATGTLCGDLSLKVTDKNAATVYNTTVLTTTMGATALNNNAGTPSSTWTGSGTAGTGSGASGNTFTLTVAPFGTFASDSTDASTSCTFSILFTQSA